MQELTPEGLEIVERLAQSHGVSAEAVLVLLHALAAGGGFQAQFSHPDLGGMGQWSQGGMIMIGDMFNQGLKYRVSALCEELAALVRGSQPMLRPAASQSQSQSSSGQGFSNQGFSNQGLGSGFSLFVPGTDPNVWWPAELGPPSSTGAQNDLRYACFPGIRRLAIKQGGQTRVYDTGEHLIGGFSQQQGGDQSLTFTSQFGLVRVADLPLVSGPGAQWASAPSVSDAPKVQDASQQDSWSQAPARHNPEKAAPVAPPEPTIATAPASSTSADDIFGMIEKLAELRRKDILTEEEFVAKKAELLSRL